MWNTPGSRRPFWTAALAAEDAPGKPTLTENMRDFAERELAKQRAAYEAAQPTVGKPRHDWSPV